MVALAILGTSVAAILGLLATGISISRRMQDRALLAELADQRLSEILLSGSSGGTDGAFAPPFQRARWRARRSAGPVRGTELLEVTVYEGADSVALATLRFR